MDKVELIFLESGNHYMRGGINAYNEQFLSDDIIEAMEKTHYCALFCINCEVEAEELLVQDKEVTYIDRELSVDEYIEKVEELTGARVLLLGDHE